jgi:hypothetical protein
MILIALTIGAKELCASELPQVQILTENLQLGESHYYNLPNLQKGDTIFVNMKRVSGNLDPIIGITKDRSDLSSFEDFYINQIPKSLEKGLDFTEVFPDFANDFFLAWDDTRGKLRDANFTYQVQKEGDYQLVVAGSYYQLIRDDKYYSTFGQYRLTIGVNTPEVLTEEVKPTGHSLASHIGKFHNRVQEITGQITEEREYIQFPLNTLDEGDTLYVFVETISGDLKPTIKLRDYGNRLLSFDNLSGENDKAELQYTLKEEGAHYTLVVRGDSGNENVTEGTFRILIGTNNPKVLTGKSDTRGRPIISEPIEVNVSLLIDQITNIDQRKENFTVVGYLVLKWVDPGFAYNPDSCKCNEMDYTSEQFDQYIKKNNLDWPRFLILNQQGKRFIQEDNFRVYPDGEVSYFERFTVTLQAPDFDFRRFPFDPQQFFFKLLLFTPIDFYVFKPNKELPAVGDKLGEEEWLINDFHTVVKTKTYNKTFSEYILQIDASRHIDYYTFRIFLPLLLILIVTWGTFFMKDYTNRIAISVSVLLILVVFNFSIGKDLPRLGYMTFMDSILFTAFLVTALSVLFNVFFRRLETTEKIELADTIDIYVTYAFPIVCMVALTCLIWIFFY